MARLHFDLPTLRRNLDHVQTFCAERGLDLLVVTKVIQSRPELLARIDHPALARVADVQASNLAKLAPGLYRQRAHLRPRVSDALATARGSDRAFVSDPLVGRALGDARLELGLPPLALSLMVEAGDLRDGVPWEDLPPVVEALGDHPGLDLVGLAANLGCMAGALPSERNMEAMVRGLRRLRSDTGHALPGFSIGGTVFWENLRGHGGRARVFPEEFTEFRLGEAAFFGWNTSKGQAIDELSTRVFEMELEILEVWRKEVGAPPDDERGYNAFGVTAEAAHQGKRRRVVVDGGENLVPSYALTPLDEGIVVVGQTHEYTVLDVTDARVELVPGRTLRFRPGYEAVARSFLSPFLELTVTDDSQ